MRNTSTGLNQEVVQKQKTGNEETSIHSLYTEIIYTKKW